MKVCRECGYVKAGDVVEGEYGKCCSEDLVFHKKVEPTEVKYGTVEYYECLLCGRLYEDPLALKPFKGNIVLLPTKFEELDSALDPDIFLDAEFDPLALISFLGNSLIKIGFWIKSFVKLTKDRDFFYGICDRLKAISSQLSEISNSLKQILADVETIPYQVKLNNRFSRIRELHEYTQICLFAMDTLMKNPCLTEKQKERIEADRELVRARKEALEQQLESTKENAEDGSKGKTAKDGKKIASKERADAWARIEEAVTEKAEEPKRAAITASNLEALLEKIDQFDWSRVYEAASVSKIDFQA